jgi:hypothetical protein
VEDFLGPPSPVTGPQLGDAPEGGDTATAEGESVFSGTRALTVGYRFLRWALIQWRAPVAGLAFMNRSHLTNCSSPDFHAYLLMTIRLYSIHESVLPSDLGIQPQVQRKIWQR